MLVQKIYENKIVQGPPIQQLVEDFDENGNTWEVLELVYPHIDEKQPSMEILPELRDYLQFMYNPVNKMNCENYMDNKNFAVGCNDAIGPCGQQHCWVDFHCNNS